MDNKTYRFLGAECQIGDTKLERFGTELKLDDAAAYNALDGGAQLCPDADFDFTEQEVSLYPFPAFRADAPEAFWVKYRAALRAVAAHREVLHEQQKVKSDE